MVLEGKGEDGDHDSDDAIGNEKSMRSSKRETWSSDVGAVENEVEKEEEEEERTEKNFATIVSRFDQSASTGSQWEWPEDVF